MSERAPVQIGRYLLFKSLKKGGMARVILGVDPNASDHLVAVKTLLPNLGKDKLYREMFASEGKVGLRLDHPVIVHTLEHGHDRGTAFIAMEFIFGYDLATVLRKLRKTGERMPLPLAVGLARDVCDGLMYAHELTDEFARPLNIVNRDVSPGNVMISFDGRPKLIDFGIAQTTIDVKSQIGSIKGKISYMSPEQVRGLPVDHRTDLFSVGTVLYEMLTGVHIFHDEGDFATMERVRRAEAPPPSAHNPAVEPELDAIVQGAMARDVVDRYPSARSLFIDLEAYLESRDLTVDAPAYARFMRSLFAQQIETLRRDIDSAREAALEPRGTRDHGDAAGLDAPPLDARQGPQRTVLDETVVPPPAGPAAPAARRSGRGWLVGLVAAGLTAAAVAILLILRS